MTFTLPELPYSYDALVPHIDAKTMEIHHTKHHQGYITKLNAALQDTPYSETSLDELLQIIPTLPENIQTAVRNNGGGHWNHSLFWQIMIPGGSAPSASFSKIIKDNFWSMDKFQDEFISSALNNFGSGWTRLIQNHDELEIINTANQDNPLMKSKKAILGLDVREHAYYLSYQNKRDEYISQRRHLIDRNKVEELYNR
jgi:superoxide dismutase, Fe-Mn family